MVCLLPVLGGTLKSFYADEIGRIGEFPEQLKPENHHPLTDLTGALSYKYLADQIEKFSLSVYTPSSYVISEAAKQRLAKEKQDFRFNQLDREKFLIGMMQTNFLKRLESSAHSLTETLERTIGKIDALLRKDLIATSRISRRAASGGRGSAR